MTFQEGNFYHIFNRGNNRQKIFFTAENYSYFLKKLSVELAEHCNLVAFCLMPNHFHILIHVQKQHTQYHSTAKMQALERKIGTLQSSYTRAINKQEKRTGSLFQPKAKVVEISDYHMAFYCFHYIHQNPVKAGLVSAMQDWSPSSYRQYSRCLDGVCKRSIAYQHLNIPSDNIGFERSSVQVINNAETRIALGDIE